MTEPEYVCCVCGAVLPHLPKHEMIERGCALKRNEEQYIYFCLGYKHTKEEITAAITGVPKFRKASDIKKGIV
jgi:hypothetical protein